MAQRSSSTPVTEAGSPRFSAVYPEGEPAEVHEFRRVQAKGGPVERAKEILHTGVSAAEDSWRAVQQRISHGRKTAARDIRAFADQRPLHFLTIVACGAFAVGVALRIWRSTHHG